MSFLSALGGGGGAVAGAGTAATAGKAAGVAGELSGFDKFMNLAAFASNPGMQEGFLFDKLLGNTDSTGDILEDISGYMSQDRMGQESTLLSFFNALDARRKKREGQNAGL